MESMTIHGLFNHIFYDLGSPCLRVLVVIEFMDSPSPWVVIESMGDNRVHGGHRVHASVVIESIGHYRVHALVQESIS